MNAESDQELARARALHRAGDPDSALRIYQRLLQTRPQQADLLILAATAAAQLQRLDEAEALGRRALEVRPDGPAALTLGRILMQRGETEEALGCFQQARTDTRVAADAAFHQGQLERAAGRLDAAAEALGAALEAAPTHGPAWNELGVTRMAQSRHEEARACFEASLKHRPGNAPTLGNLARACIEAGDLTAAAQAIDVLRADDPDNAGALILLGTLRKQQGRLAEAAAVWEQATMLAPADADAWTGLATTRQAMAEYPAADAAYGRALALAPDNPDTIAARAEWLEWQGRYQEGLDSLDVLTPEQRLGAGPTLVAARLWRRLGDPARARDLLARAMPPGGSVRRPFCFSLGDACDELASYAEAWSWYQQGNASTPADFDPLAQGRLFEQVERAAADIPPGQGGDDLVFIVGMPRSGTSLLEQMLDAHPLVHGAGELPLLGELVHGVLTADTRERATRLARLADDYRRDLPQRSSSAQRLVDKMPLNFQYLPLIRAAFPQARVIHCRRDPRDIAVSCYFTDFADQALGFATRLDWLAAWLTGYQQVMARWSGACGPVIEFDYEALIAAPESTLRPLLDALGLAWDPGCLDFAKQGRVVATASHAQVRQPLHGRSVGRWRHYEDWLGPLLALEGSGS